MKSVTSHASTYFLISYPNQMFLFFFYMLLSNEPLLLFYFWIVSSIHVDLLYHHFFDIAGMGMASQLRPVAFHVALYATPDLGFPNPPPFINNMNF